MLEGVDVATVASKIFSKAFMNAGQVCIAVKRVYAHSSIYDALCDALAKLADEAIIGDGLQQETQIGPVQNAAQFAKAKTFLESARREGRIISGGDVAEGEGYFIRPTIVRDIEDGAMLVDQEQFAPILPVIRFDDVDDAIRRTNSSDLGLGGSVWSGDRERAYAVARRIESGMVRVNEHLDFAPTFHSAAPSSRGSGWSSRPTACSNSRKPRSSTSQRRPSFDGRCGVAFRWEWIPAGKIWRMTCSV